MSLQTKTKLFSKFSVARFSPARLVCMAAEVARTSAEIAPKDPMAVLDSEISTKKQEVERKENLIRENQAQIEHRSETPSRFMQRIVTIFAKTGENLIDLSTQNPLPMVVFTSNGRDFKLQFDRTDKGTIGLTISHRSNDNTSNNSISTPDWTKDANFMNDLYVQAVLQKAEQRFDLTPKK